MSGGVYVKRLWWLWLLLPLAWALPAGAQEEADTVRLGSYELGRGLPLGDTGFTLGGYATLRYENLRRQEDRLALDHLSLMLWWEGNGRFKFFTEADLEEGVATARPGTDDERFLALERFYLDYAATDRVTLRAGKFLTPIGHWNLIHADPLVWTTSRPLVTEVLFPPSTTGLMVLGTAPLAARALDYAVFVANGREWRRKPGEDPFSEAWGARVNLPLTGRLQVGASFASFEQEGAPDEHRRLAGLDFQWHRNRWELSAEAVQRRTSGLTKRTDRGGFLQAAIPLTRRLYGVARGEALRLAGSGRTARVWVAGVNYRYSRAISLKAEWVTGRDDADTLPDGFLASASVLF